MRLTRSLHHRTTALAQLESEVANKMMAVDLVTLAESYEGHPVRCPNLPNLRGYRCGRAWLAWGEIEVAR
jgi:hypothetical protein